MASRHLTMHLADDQPALSRMRVYPRFHDLSPDENHALSTVLVVTSSFGMCRTEARGDRRYPHTVACIARSSCQAHEPHWARRKAA